MFCFHVFLRTAKKKAIWNWNIDININTGNYYRSLLIFLLYSLLLFLRLRPGCPPKGPWIYAVRTRYGTNTATSTVRSRT